MILSALPMFPRDYSALNPLPTSGANCIRKVSYARKSNDFNALSEHSKVRAISA